MNMKKTTIIACMIFIVAATVGASAQISVNAEVRPDQVITSFAGSTRFKDLRGLWLDRKTNEFYVIDESPLTVYKFDRNANPVNYQVLSDLGVDLKGVSFAGADRDYLYLKHSDGLVRLTMNFQDIDYPEYFFAPYQDDPEKEQELIPVDFKYVFPAKDEKAIYGFDPKKKILYKCDEEGKCKVFIRTVMKYGIDILTGNMKSIVRDQWNRFFFVDEQSHQVWKFADDGRFMGAAAREIDPVVDKLYQPELVAFDRIQQCYIYDAGVLKIKMYNDIGMPIGDIDVNQMMGPLFINPIAMEIDDLNRMYVLDKGDMTVKIFEISY